MPEEERKLRNRKRYEKCRLNREYVEKAKLRLTIWNSTEKGKRLRREANLRQKQKPGYAEKHREQQRRRNAERRAKINRERAEQKAALFKNAQAMVALLDFYAYYCKRAMEDKARLASIRYSKRRTKMRQYDEAAHFVSIINNINKLANYTNEK